MSLFLVYLRVLGQLGPERRTGMVLAAANVMLAIAAFAEPILFGRIIDVLSKSASSAVKPGWDEILPLMMAWAGFGIFTIAAGSTSPSPPTGWRIGVGSASWPIISSMR